MGGEWVKRKISSIGRVITGKTPPTANRSNFGGPYPFITIPDLDGRVVIDRTERTLTEEGAEMLRSCLLPPGAVMMSCIATVGKCGITARPSFTNQQINSVIPSDDVDPHFLYYVFTQLGHELESAGGGGSVYTNVSKNRFSDIAVFLPSDLKQQRAIAHILGTLDDKIELNRRMSETLEAMARALFKSWFVDFEPVRAKMDGRWQRAQSLPGLPAHLYDLFPDRLVDSELNEIPKGWGVGKLSELCSTQYGYTASAVDEPVGPKLLRVTDINKRNWIDWADVPHCFVEAGKRATYALQVGDLVVARMADPGKSAIIEEHLDAVFASYLVRLKTASLAHSYYIYGFLKSDLYAEYAEGAKSGSVQSNMNAKVIVGASLVVPPAVVMEQFLREVFPIRQRLVASIRESRTLAALRDALLPKLISGELRVKDAEKLVLQSEGGLTNG